MQKDFNYEELSARAYAYLKEKLIYHRRTCNSYRFNWLNVKRYMESNQWNLISAAICKSFLLTIYKGRRYFELSCHEQNLHRSVRILIEFMETGEVREKKRAVYLDGSIGELIKNYIASKKSRRLSQLTILRNESHLSKFNHWLSINAIFDIGHIEQRHIHGFIKSIETNKKALIHGALADLKNFFKYLYEQNIIATNIAAAVPKDNYNSQSKIPSCYSEDEIQKLLKSINRATALGKRDYAVLLIAAHLGLRSSDIARLKFDNLHWDKSKLVIKQFKTGKDVSLPLIPIVGNAILEYIQYGRPQSTEQYIFLQARPPYLPVTPLAISGLAARRFKNANIEIGERRRGPHALRHSLVNELLKNRQTLPVITEVLGHKNTQSTKHYIRIDTVSLRQCALDAPMVDPSFYTQQNGILFL